MTDRGSPPLADIPGSAPPGFHIMAKPAGAACNLDCAYCFYLEKERLYADGPPRMSDAVQESFIRQTIEGQRVPSVTLTWQGGEPTLMGVAFFERAAALEKRHLRPGMAAERTLQTNGVLLDESWCRCLRENRYLVGLSLDGPREMHDAFRVDKAGRPTFDRVVAAARLLQRERVDFNILCTVNARNGDHPREVYRFFRDEVGARYLQFIPVVERGPGGEVTGRSVGPEQYGGFLCGVFDEWIWGDVGEVFVVNFDASLANWLGSPSTCIFSETCGTNLALERNGDLYSCDHFVDPEHRLGNIVKTPLVELVVSERQVRFGNDKRDTLPRCCLACDVRFACHGECPKNRFLRTPEGEGGINYLCAGYQRFFRHVDRPMKIMAALLRQGRPAPDIMGLLATERCATLGRNDPCPCGSGRKVKQCHGGTP